MSSNLVDIVLVPIVVGLVEVLKKLGIPTSWAAVVAVVLGVALKYAQVALSQQYQDVLLGGVATGLAAAGLYSGAKAVLKAE